MPAGLPERVRTWLMRDEHVPVGARVIVGVSGGADSVALLHLLSHLREQAKYRLHVAHLDHGLRKGSEADAEFVQELAVRWRIPCTIERREVRVVCEQEGWSLEDGARRIRYAFLAQVVRTQSATHLALAHTADDQAETVLMRLLRGAGLLGLGAIPMRRRLDEAWIVRPLLDAWRGEIRDYLTAHRLSFREDESNQDLRFTRNRVRHALLPLLEREYNPNIKRALTQLAEQCRWDYAFLQDASARQWKRTSRRRAAPATDPVVAILVQAFLKQPKALQRQLLRRAIDEVSGDAAQIEFRHWLEAEALFSRRPVGSLVDLPGGVQLQRQRDHVMCRRTPGADRAASGGSSLRRPHREGYTNVLCVLPDMQSTMERIR